MIGNVYGRFYSDSTVGEVSRWVRVGRVVFAKIEDWLGQSICKIR